MLQLVRNIDIDRNKWDACIGGSPYAKPYGFSWYLDIVSPQWMAFVEDDYSAVFPLPCFRKYGIKYMATPAFLQQLGVFSTDKHVDINAFVNKIPKAFKLIDLAVNESVNDSRYSVFERSNYELSLNRDYDVIFSEYDTGCRRNIRLAKNVGQQIVADVTPDELLSLYKKNVEPKAGKMAAVKYDRLNRLMRYSCNSGKGKLLGIRSDDGLLQWGTFIIDFHNRITVLVMAGSSLSRKMRSAYFGYDYIIGKNAGKDKILDFCGSSIPSIAHFKKSFGSKKTVYYRIYRNTLPLFVKRLKKC